MTRTTALAPALSLAFAALPGLALAAPDGWQPLLQPTELAALIERGEDIHIIRVTGDFAAGHIPGAVFSPYEKWRAGPTNPGAVLPELEYESEAVRVGVTAERPTVIVHDGASPSDMGAAARVYWTLKSLGVEDLALLNGGYQGWAKAGLPTATGDVTPTESDFYAEWRDDWYIPTSEVVALVESGEARLLDSRPEGFFQGIAWSIARPGTIRSAENLQFSQFFQDGLMVGPERAREIAAEQGLLDSPVTVSFCNTGHWAALNWFALSELAEVPNTRLYAESMAEYTIHGHPLDNEPNRAKYLWFSAKAWVQNLF